MLDVSRSDARKDEVTSLAATLTGIADLIRLTAGPSVTVDFEIGASLPLVLCSARELENVILNLVINARDAMPAGGLLSLTVLPEYPHRDVCSACTAETAAVLRVRDTGSGMSPDVAARAFDPFFTTKPMGNGSGLGLAMVADFARRSGGVAEFDSAVGQGTTISLRLPGAGADQQASVG
jgi:signal transduction histidine kinase